MSNLLPRSRARSKSRRKRAQKENKPFTFEEARKKVSGARFRGLNETLYNQTGEDSFRLFNENKKLYKRYHEGFAKQVDSWPLNPVDYIIEKLQKHDDKLTIGDFGCGEAKIAKTFTKRKVYSFDLVSIDPDVTACNIANLPLDDSSLDIGVFCLSLMGRDWPSFISEASRCLKIGGFLYIMEVKSRLTNKVKFIKFICQFGYQIDQIKEVGNGFFVCLIFTYTTKTSYKPLDRHNLLMPCLYKKR